MRFIMYICLSLYGTTIIRLFRKQWENERIEFQLRCNEACTRSFASPLTFGGVSGQATTGHGRPSESLKAIEGKFRFNDKVFSTDGLAYQSFCRRWQGEVLGIEQFQKSLHRIPYSSM